MKKISVSIENCSPGMKMAETLYNEFGAAIINEGTTLDLHLINKMVNLNIRSVSVYYASDTQIETNADAFIAQYSSSVESIKNILHSISDGEEVPVNEIKHISDSILIKLDDKRDIVSCISRMSDVDKYTYTHSVNVSMLCMLAGKWHNMPEDRIKQLVQAGLLHDIGKSKVPESILNKPGALTPEEFDEVKKHPTYGYRMLENSPGVTPDILKGILMHHEREDGSGYPIGAKGSQIHEFARIIAVADVYDAMTSNRVYKDKESPFEIFITLENSIFGKLNPVVVREFLNNIAAYYIGDYVKLSTGQTAEIVFINPANVSKPIVKVQDEYIDLLKKKDVKITGLL